MLRSHNAYGNLYLSNFSLLSRAVRSGFERRRSQGRFSEGLGLGLRSAPDSVDACEGLVPSLSHLLSAWPTFERPASAVIEGFISKVLVVIRLLGRDRVALEVGLETP